MLLAFQPIPVRFNVPLAGAPNLPLRPLLKQNDLQLQQTIAYDLMLKQMLERQIDAIRLERFILQDFDKYERYDLTVRMRDPNPLIRWLAIQSASTRHIHCEDELINRLKDPVPGIREAARNALVKLSRGADFGPARASGPTPVATTRERDQAMAGWRGWLRKQEETPSTTMQE